MTDYALNIVPTTNAQVKFVKDTNSPKWVHRGSKMTRSEQYRFDTANAARRTIPSNVSSIGIDVSSAYNGFNDLVAKIDESKTDVTRENGFLGFGCTKRTITYFDKDGNMLFKRYIDEDQKINQITFKGANGNSTTLWDNNNNGNFECMKQDVQHASRDYAWFDDSDNKKGNYDAVIMSNYPRGAFYKRSYDFNQEKVTQDYGTSPSRFLPNSVHNY